MIGFATTCQGRLQHIRETLPRNLADNPGACKFVLVDYNSQDGLDRYLQAEHRSDMDSGRLTVYSFPTAGNFRMAHAKNLAHRCAILDGADIVCNLDGDNFTGPGFADYLSEQFGGRRDLFLWARMIKDGEGRLPKGISGRIVVPADAYIKVGGYDEKYETWSPDDKDFQTRLRRLGFEAREIDSRFLQAIMHNDRMRFRAYPEAKSRISEEDFHLDIYESEVTIANFGNFGCGTVYRNYDTQPIHLGPVPTRIFGVGMHKTATTSLHHALTILGCDSAHWQTAHWAKAIWEEMQASQRSLTLEQHYALCDLPITILYRQLDMAYPGSKFILTVRDEGAWLRSVQNHWSHDHNPFRASWATDPFTHRVHKLVYGTKGFDADVFLARYRQHNAEVQEYFRDRPNDLLVMRKPGWPELCRFLGRSVPQTAYPKACVTRRP